MGRRVVNFSRRHIDVYRNLREIDARNPSFVRSAVAGTTTVRTRPMVTRYCRDHIEKHGNTSNTNTLEGTIAVTRNRRSGFMHYCDGNFAVFANDDTVGRFVPNTHIRLVNTGGPIDTLKTEVNNTDWSYNIRMCYLGFLVIQDSNRRLRELGLDELEDRESITWDLRSIKDLKELIGW